MNDAKIERKSSIENEPLTLDFDEIEFAREAALFVLNTNTTEEAFRIFTEGLQPIEKCAKGGGPEKTFEREDSEDDEGHKCNPCWTKKNNNKKLRDVVSAPF